MSALRLKYIALILAASIIALIIYRIERAVSHNDGATTINVPADSNFTPVENKSYRPPSLPFSPRKLPVKLPRGLKERDVKRVITIDVSGVPKHPPKEINVIETTSGAVFVQRDSSIESVSVTNVEPPILVFGLTFGVGATLGESRSGGRPELSPAGIFAPVQWDGWLHAPILVADLDGVGPGAEARLYHNIFAGAARLWRYDEGIQLKLLLSYVF
jgi:hypothetical protein